MSYSISGTSIQLTRGDTFVADITINKADGTAYVPEEGDTIRFAMKASYDEAEPLLVKDVPIATMKLVLDPADTKQLDFGSYFYDIELTKSSGEVDTFITKAKIKITEEVH